MEQPFNEHNSLRFIESMINRAKDKFNENGTLYLLWGIIVFICGMVQFVGIHFYNYEEAYHIWFLTWLVVIYQMIFLFRKAKQEKVKTYTADILKYVWLCFVACMFIVIFILQYQKAYNSIDAAILVLYGMPTFLSGAILRYKPLVTGGVACWVLAIGSVFVDADFQVLFICAAVLVAWIIPGYMLRIKFKNQNN